MSPDTLAGAPDPESPPDRRQVAERARAVLDRHWRTPGFCVPNATTYPWQWLWDSCFHAVCWAQLGEGDRGVVELTHALAEQAADGFVPHMTYWSATGRPDDRTHAAFWGREATSSITQPPMYGHAVAELLRRGVTVPDELIEQARRGLRFLLEARGRDERGPVIVHPWESGCDDSLRWDAWCAGGWRADRWKVEKGELMAAVRFDGRRSPASAGPTAGPTPGSPMTSALFEVAPAGFGVLVAFNAAELAEVTGDETLAAEARVTSARIDRRWSPERATWTDDVVTGPPGSAAARTVEALLPVLVSEDGAAVDAAFAELLDDAAFGGTFGPAGVHRDEPSFDPGAYWRGPAWPQLTYLMWLAATRRGRRADAAQLSRRLVTGAWHTGFAEYWDPDTGEGHGAAPQSWTALAAVVD